MKEVIYQNKYFMHLLFAMSIFIILIAISLEFLFVPKFDSPDYIDYDSDWGVYYNGKKYYADDISGFHFPEAIKSGDVILLRNKIPDISPNNCSISFLLSLSGIRAFVDGQQVYDRGLANAKNGTLAPTCYHFIPLPDNSSGKTILIEILPTDNNAFTNIGNIKLIRSDLAYYFLACHKRGTLFVSLFLITLGIIGFFVGIMVSVYKHEIDPALHIGALSFFIGLWALCYDNLIQLFSNNLRLTTITEYYALYSSIIPALFLVRFFLLNEKSSEGTRREVNCLIIICVIFLLTVITLAVTNIVHAPSMLPYFHIMVLLIMVVIFFSMRRTKKSKHIYKSILQFGMIELCIIVIMDLLRYNIQKYLFANDAKLGVPLTPYATLTFIIILICSYMIRSYTIMSQRIAAKTEKEVLLKMAYNDRLTGLFNRAMAEEILEGLASDENNYCLISIDLNGLKKINDTYGHQKGDLLITEFSKILKESFDPVGNSFRMGGDEFMLLVYEEKWAELPNAIEKMNQLSKERSEELDIPICASYGMAKNTEKDLYSSEDVYKLADSRMYEMKAASKK